MMTKKITLLVLATIAMFVANSQSIENESQRIPSILTPSNSYYGTNLMFKDGKSKLYKGTPGSGWYSYLSAYIFNNQSTQPKFTYYTGQPIWRDSFPVTTGNGEANNVSLHAVGQLFDPKSEFYNDPDFPAIVTLSKYNRYTVDSVRFSYKYQNFVPGSVDTLLVQFYNADKIIRLFYRNQAGQVIGYTDAPTYDKVNKIGLSTSSVKVLLSDANNTDSFFTNNFASFTNLKTITLPAAINVPEGKNFGFTVTYLPGVIANLGDTLITSSTPITNYPAKKLNTFQPLLYKENDFLGDTSYNHGLFAFSSVRYSTNANVWFNAGGSVSGSTKLSIDGDFFIRYYNLSAKDINNQGYGLGSVYPNPVKVGNDVKIEFALGRAETVNLQLFNLLGSKVADIASAKFGAGENSVTYNTSDLAPGVYVYTLTAGGFKSSKKITVIN